MNIRMVFKHLNGVVDSIYEGPFTPGGNIPPAHACGVSEDSEEGQARLQSRNGGCERKLMKRERFEKEMQKVNEEFAIGPGKGSGKAGYGAPQQYGILRKFRRRIARARTKQ